MTSSIETNWIGDMAFTTDIDGHTITIDADAAVGGKDQGARPKPFLLMALSGCTGMDVVSLLKKMRVDFKDFKVGVDGELTDEHPKYYNKLHISYKLWGVKEEDYAKVEKAVTLSKTRYCGVSAMLEKSSEVTYEIIYN